MSYWMRVSGDKPRPTQLASIEHEGIRVTLGRAADGVLVGVVHRDMQVLFREELESEEQGLAWFDEAMDKLGDGQFHSWIQLVTKQKENLQ